MNNVKIGAEDSSLDFLLPLEVVETNIFEERLKSFCEKEKNIFPLDWEHNDESILIKNLEQKLSSLLIEDHKLAIRWISTLALCPQFRSMLISLDSIPILISSIDEEDEILRCDVIEALRFLALYASNRTIFDRRLLENLIWIISICEKEDLASHIRTISCTCGLLYSVHLNEIGIKLLPILSSKDFNSLYFTLAMINFVKARDDPFVNYTILSIIICAIIEYIERGNGNTVPEWFTVLLKQFFDTGCFNSILNRSVCSTGIHRTLLFKMISNIVFASPKDSINTNVIRVMLSVLEKQDLELRGLAITVVDELMQRSNMFSSATFENILKLGVIGKPLIQAMSQYDNLILVNFALKLTMRIASNQIAVEKQQYIRPYFASILECCANVISILNDKKENFGPSELGCTRQSTGTIGIILQMDYSHAEKMIEQGVLDNVMRLCRRVPKKYIDNCLVVVYMLFRASPIAAINRVQRGVTSKRELKQFKNFLQSFIDFPDQDLDDNPKMTLMIIKNLMKEHAKNVQQAEKLNRSKVKCAYCNLVDAKQKCCRNATYCDQECQKKDEIKHKRMCMKRSTR